MRDSLTAPWRIHEYDIFLDLSRVAGTGIAEHLKKLVAEEGLIVHARHISVLLPESCAAELIEAPAGIRLLTEPVQALSLAINTASEHGRSLAVVIGAWRWRNHTLQALSAYVDSDPMIATIQPRFSDKEARHVLGFPGNAENCPTIAAATFLPEYYVAPESLAALSLLTPQAAAAAPPLTGTNLQAAYTELLRGLRRRGYRNLICNQILAPWTGHGECYLPLAEGLIDKDAEQRAEVFATLPERRLEALLSAAYSPEGRPRILLDCRGMPPFMNGTAVCVLGFLEGFKQLSSARGAEITVLANAKAARFHGLSTRFPDFEIQMDAPHGSYMAAILLNQPWSVEAMRDLHAISGLIMFNMLDTISWDIIYAYVKGLDRTWRLLGQYADVLFFNSAYSRDRYSFRFRPDDRIPRVVTHHSMTPAEIAAKPVAPPPGSSRYVLVMGNDYDHKEVVNTVKVISEAFPFLDLVCIGVKEAMGSKITVIESGNITSERIASIFYGASAVVFPSHYEGFGLPVAEALAFDRPAIVRKSPLWEEISLLTPKADLISQFSLECELVAAVGAALHTGTTAAANRTEAGQIREPTWADCAGKMLDAVEMAIAGFDGQKWIARDAFFSFV